MNIPNKKLKSGFSLPVYGLGTWEMGGRWEPDTSKDDKEIQAIKNAIDHGITHIDTAESYGVGHCEELVGRAIKGYDRSKLFITTKVSAHNQGYDGVMKSFKASLARLDTNYVDLYLLHRYPEPGLSIKDTMRAMDELMEKGLIKNIGVCNLTVPMFKEAQKHTKNKIVCNQVHYSLDCREIVDKGILKYCQDNDVLIVAWGPLSKGVLDEAEILKQMANKYNKTPYQIAINWLLCQKNVITIPKTTQLEHLEENLGALGWEMSDDDVKELTEKFPNQRLVSSRVPLDYAVDLKDAN